MYLLRDLKNESIMIDLAEYKNKNDFIRQLKPIIQIACLNKIFIWISNSKGNIKKLIKYTTLLNRYYSELGVVIDSNIDNLDSYIKYLSRNNLSLILNCLSSDEEIYQIICNLTRQESIPRICVYFPTGVPSYELQELAKWHKNLLYLMVSPSKIHFAIRAKNKDINCSLMISFGELINKNNLINNKISSLNKFKNLFN